MKVDLWPIERARPYERNPRINDGAVDAVAASIREFGFRQPIVVDAKGLIICGHARWKAAQKLGLKKVPVHVAKDLSPAQVKAYRIADNKVGEASQWDEPLLSLELGDLALDQYDLALTGFDEREWSRLLAPPAKEGLSDADAIPPVPKVAVTKPGDLWLLGEHRLLCGDSTKAEDVARVMRDDRAGLMNTDPPYGVAYKNEERPRPGKFARVAKPRVKNDTLCDAELQAFLEAAFRAAKSVALADRAAWYLWHAHLTQGYFAAAAAAAAANVVLHRQIIWVKPVLLLTRGQYHWKHEPCFMGWVEGQQPPDYGSGNRERNQTTVWELGGVSQQDRKQFEHATPKPVALFEIPIVKHLQHEEICYEPFAGSGPQFIAAERLNRRCFGLEIEPNYCDVIVARWQKFTGGKAVLEGGRPTPTVRQRKAPPKIARGKQPPKKGAARGG